MISLKNLKKQAVKAADLSFKSGKLDEATAKKIIKSFKSLPMGESIPLLTYYLRALKRGLDKSTLTISSAVKISSATENELASLLKKDFKILKVDSEIEPSILGGIKVRIGDIIFDNSLKSKVEQVAQALSN